MAMNRRQRRAFRRQWDKQINEERNGAPIPPEIAERMTKPIERILYQVVVTKTADHKPLRVGPAMIRDAAEMLAEAINKAVAAGQERTWSDATVAPCLSARTETTPADQLIAA